MQYVSKDKHGVLNLAIPELLLEMESNKVHLLQYLHEYFHFVPLYSFPAILYPDGNTVPDILIICPTVKMCYRSSKKERNKSKI